jgi:predicted O-methyltransferase YrrM
MPGEPLPAECRAYLVAQAEPPSAVQRNLVERTRALGGPAEMRIPHEQGVFLTLLAKLVNARRIVEGGTFTGCSTLALAEGLAPGGREAGGRPGMPGRRQAGLPGVLGGTGPTRSARRTAPRRQRPVRKGNALAIREFDKHVRADDRVESVMLTVADGLTVARKR